MTTLDDVGEAVGRVAERFDAMVRRRKDQQLWRHGRRHDGYLSSELVPTDKTLRRTDGSASTYVQQLRAAEEVQSKDQMNIVFHHLQSEPSAVLAQVMREYALHPGEPKNRAEAVRRIEQAWIRNVRFANKTR